MSSILPLFRRRQILMFGGSALLGGCVTTDKLNPFADKPPKPIDRVKSGKIAYANMDATRTADLGSVSMGGSALATTPALDAYLNQVLGRLMDQLGGPRPPAQAYVLAEPAPGAFAYPSGAIFITHGMLGQIANEDQLAFILGHELGHVALKHHGSDFLKKTNRYALHAAETYWGFRGGGGGGVLGMPPWLAAGYATTIMTRDIISPSWNREQEDDADRFGLDVMVAAGYNLEAAKGVMAILQAAEQKFTKETAIEYTAFDEAIIKTQADAEQKGKSGTDPLSAGVAEAFSNIGKGLSESRQTHRSTEERLGRLDEYILKFYDEADTPSFRTEPLRAALAEAGTAQALGRYRQSAEAVQRVVSGAAPAIAPPPPPPPRQQSQQRPRTALPPPPPDPLTIVSTAPSGALSADNFLNRYAAYLNHTVGRMDVARRHLETATTLATPSGDIVVRLALQYMEEGRAPDAVTLVDRGIGLYGEMPAFLQSAILARGKAGRMQEAQAIATRCQLSNPEAKRLCSDAIEKAKAGA